jgi:hypothetical protein
MPRSHSPGFRFRARGSSIVEFALSLPILLVLVFGVVDFARALQFSNVLVSMSREAANLSARTTALPEYIISALEITAQPLDMGNDGMIYITALVGRANAQGVVTAYVQEQHRLVGGRPADLASRVYACPSWAADGSCNISANARPLAAIAVTLADGQVIEIAETEYLFQPIVGYVMQAQLPLYSQTVL